MADGVIVVRRRLLATIRSGDWLTAARIRGYCVILLVLETTAIALLWLSSSGGIDRFGHPVGTDFISFYAAGALAGSTVPTDVYQVPMHMMAEQYVFGTGQIPYYAFYYPPAFLAVCWTLAKLPYLAALVAWLGVTLAGLGLTLRPILPGRAILLALLAFPACFLNIGHGQNAFLTAALFGGGTLLVARRPFLAGLLFGALCYKPQLALLVPVALVAGGHWRALAGAAAGALVLAALATLGFGSGIWPAYAAIVPAAQAAFVAGGVGFEKMASLFAATRLIGGGAMAANLIQGIGMLAAGLATFWAWSRPVRLPIRAAILCAGALLAAPVLLDYDLVLALVAIAWLTRDGLEVGFAPFEKTLLAIVYAIPLFARPVGGAVSVPLAPFAAMILLSLAISRAITELRSIPPNVAA